MSHSRGEKQEIKKERERERVTDFFFLRTGGRASGVRGAPGAQRREREREREREEEKLTDDRKEKKRKD